MPDLLITPTKLHGCVKVPPSKSMAHRMVICASLAKGKSVIEGVELSDDIEATIGAMRALGAQITVSGDTLKVLGASPFQDRAPKRIDCNESGSTLRFCVPIFAALGIPAHFVGRGNLGKRPMQPFYDIFDRQGISYHAHEGSLDLEIDGKLRPELFSTPGNVSSQFITGLLFALPLLGEGAGIHVTTELESGQYLDLTREAMADFGVEVTIDGVDYRVSGSSGYSPSKVQVEGDYSQAAFFYVANALGSDVRMEGLRPDSLQGDKAVIDILARMGAQFGQDGAKLSHGPLHATQIDASDCPDIIPVLALAAALSKGTTRIEKAGRLRMKECDRLSATVKELSALGADIREAGDGMVITGADKLKGGTVSSHNDHRMAMMLSIAATCCEEPVLLKDYTCVSKSYGGFFDDFRNLGGITYEQ